MPPPSYSVGSLSAIVYESSDWSQCVGTYFRAIGAALDAPHAGHAVLFPGRLEHAGQPITRGTRYVIVLFCGYDSNLSGRPNGWVMQRFVELGGKYDGGAPAADARGPEKDEL